MMENFYLGTCRRCAGLLTYALLLASPLKDIMVHVAETTAFLDKKKKKKNALDNKKNCDKHLPPV